jgi:Beta-lactamase
MVGAEKDDTHILQKTVHPITIREVLCHMSGLPFQSAIEKPTLDGLPLAAEVRSYAMTPLQTEPGTKYQYSNAGINTAARIRTAKGLALVWMVQHGGFPGDGEKEQGVFKNWAIERFGE